MQPVADVIRERVAELVPQLSVIDPESLVHPPAPGKWSKQEVLGHLIDSAANNHQRVVRARIDGELRFPAYQQNAWVASQGYGDADWRELVPLWAALNRHLARAIELLPENALSSVVRIGDSEPVTLGWMVEDYVRHLDHHLAQILPEVQVGRISAPGFDQLRDFLTRIPGIDTILGHGTAPEGSWWIKFIIDLEHPLAWNVVQELAHVLNLLSLQERLPTVFKPLSPPPYINGGPVDYLSWVIDCDDPSCTPEAITGWLESRLPDPVDELEAWEPEE
ncbi:MAG: DinB family protein [Candidatus Eisenbacteria bacterium]|nr:DinB family protein [Candidatus Eisenbacteria bacterium]